MVTSLVGLSTSTPARAYSYNFFPFTLTAENMAVSVQFSQSMIRTLLEFVHAESLDQSFFSSTFSPLASSVVVEKPMVTSPSYAFPASVKYSAIFVALPIQIGKTPVTSDLKCLYAQPFLFLISSLI